MNLIDYQVDNKYCKKVAYFSMEFAIHQALKIYSGGLGFLAGSHMRSAYEMRQNTIGVGILWSYGYYDQIRGEDRSMRVVFTRKTPYFLEDNNILVSLRINGKIVFIKVLILKSSTFHSAPLLLLTTDIPENDFLAKTITHKLYDGNEETRIAQEIVLGIGGAKALEAVGFVPDIYHMNEGHSVPLTYYLYNKYNDIDEVKKRVVFTTHTPEPAGNEEHNIHLLQKMGFFYNLPLDTIREITKINSDNFSLTLAGLRLSKITNAVSKLHKKVTEEMWKNYDDISPIISITNAQNQSFWTDKPTLQAFKSGDDRALIERKEHNKRRLFDIVADQTGKMFKYDVLTIVWARRFAEYKRPKLLVRDFKIFKKMLKNSKMPIQLIWAGKPYPSDSNSVNIFNELVYISKEFSNMAVLTGYELNLSFMLKKGSDIWLNTPRIHREASGTSGMTAGMNGAINLSIMDGWIPEFIKDGENGFAIPPVDASLPIDEQDEIDYQNLIDIINNRVLPTYYHNPKKWVSMMKKSMEGTLIPFGANRMVDEYYRLMYNCE